MKKYKNTSREDIRMLRSLAADGARVGEMLLSWFNGSHIGSLVPRRSSQCGSVYIGENHRQLVDVYGGRVMTL